MNKCTIKSYTKETYQIKVHTMKVEGNTFNHNRIDPHATMVACNWKKYNKFTCCFLYC